MTDPNAKRLPDPAELELVFCAAGQEGVGVWPYSADYYKQRAAREWFECATGETITRIEWRYRT